MSNPRTLSDVYALASAFALLSFPIIAASYWLLSSPYVVFAILAWIAFAGTAVLSTYHEVADDAGTRPPADCSCPCVCDASDDPYSPSYDTLDDTGGDDDD